MNDMNNDEKICPFCGELIKLVAIKCKHCNSKLNNDIPENFSSASKKNSAIESIYSYKTMSQGYMVAVILLPIFGQFIEIFVSDNFDGGKYSSEEIYQSIYWTVLYAVLNSIFCFLDAKKLEAHGIHVKYSSILGLLLVPLYICIRGIKTNKHFKLGWIKSQIFFIAWIVSILLSIPLEQYLLNLFFDN